MEREKQLVLILLLVTVVGSVAIGAFWAAIVSTIVPAATIPTFWGVIVINLLATMAWIKRRMG